MWPDRTPGRSRSTATSVTPSLPDLASRRDVELGWAAIVDKAFDAAESVAVAGWSEFGFDQLRTPAGGTIDDRQGGDQLAIADARQEFLFLCFRARLENHLRRRDTGRKHRSRQRAAPELLKCHCAVHHADAAPAVCLRYQHASQPCSAARR